MNPFAVYVENAAHMMIHTYADRLGVQLTFADGCRSRIPFADIPEIKQWENLAGLKLPNPYELILNSRSGEAVEIPWDFARHYCDISYRSKAEAIAALGRKTLGNRIRKKREIAGMTQGSLAAAAGIGRVTLSRIEGGKGSPRYDTLLSISNGLRCPIEELLVGNEQGDNSAMRLVSQK